MGVAVGAVNEDYMMHPTGASFHKLLKIIGLWDEAKSPSQNMAALVTWHTDLCRTAMSTREFQENSSGLVSSTARGARMATCTSTSTTASRSQVVFQGEFNGPMIVRKNLKSWRANRESPY